VLIRANEVLTLVGFPDRLHAIVAPLPDFPFNVTLKRLLQCAKLECIPSIPAG
jgi:hypothetical protein